MSLMALSRTKLSVLEDSWHRQEEDLNLSTACRSDLTWYFCLPSDFKALCFSLKRAIYSFPNMACSFLLQLLPEVFPGQNAPHPAFCQNSAPSSCQLPGQPPSLWNLPDVIRLLKYPHSSAAFCFILQFSGFTVDS